jgi:hypothetical protein
MDRPVLTFNGEAADVPPSLSEQARTAVSFLLEEDRARAISLRCPIVDIRDALARHVVAGGPEVNSLRLDYLVAFAKGTSGKPVDHRALTDKIEREKHTPGARLTTRRSDAIHGAFVGEGKGTRRPADLKRYEELVRDELGYKSRVVDRALATLARLPESNLREVHRAIEGDAQEVWRRRLKFHASDLVRFGRTYRYWRNLLVPAIEADGRCAAQLLALTNPQAALDSARDAGSRELATARVVATEPLTLDVDSRRIGHETRVALLHVGSDSCVESPGVETKFQKGGFRLSGLSIGPLEEVHAAQWRFEWFPEVEPAVAVGDELVIADLGWFGSLVGNTKLPIDRPATDQTAAPKPDCDLEDYDTDSDGHRFCCRPHEFAEAEWSDELARRRAAGELNPEAWPPVVDEDAFEVSVKGAAVGDPSEEPVTRPPDDVTADDLD